MAIISNIYCVNDIKNLKNSVFTVSNIGKKSKITIEVKIKIATQRALSFYIPFSYSTLIFRTPNRLATTLSQGVSKVWWNLIRANNP